MAFMELVKELIFTHIPSIIRQFFILLFSGWSAVVDYRHKVFSTCLDEVAELYNQKVGDRKAKLFQVLSTLESADETLRKKGVIRILEIGIGTGTNLEYYPKKCELVAVDPNGHCESSLRKMLEKYDGINLEKYIIAPGEDMKEISTASVDAVVTTLVACSVTDLDKVISEIRRVLSPNGCYIFMEHIQSEPTHWKSLIQKFLNVSKIWPLMFDGCTFMPRNMMRDSCQKHFTKLEIEEFDVDPSGRWVYQLCYPHVSGVATN